MRKLKTLFKIGLVGSLFLTITLNTFASDTDRITLLEKEVQELKLRLLKIEAPQGSKQNTLAASQGWKVQANWRSLKKGMSYDEVRTTLGEPVKVSASGPFTEWNYSNRSDVTFHQDKLYGWNEPR